MKKAALVLMVIIFSGAYALAQPPGPPPHHGPPPHGELGPPPPPPPPPSGGDRAEAWRKFAQENPEKAKKLMRVCREHPELQCGFGPGARGRSRGRPGMMNSERRPGRKFNPEFTEKKRKLRELREETRKLGKEYQSAESATEKKKIEAKIREKLDEIYKLKLEVMRDRVKDVEKKLKRVKSELVKYEKDRKGVINSWLNQVTGKTRYKKF